MSFDFSCFSLSTRTQSASEGHLTPQPFRPGESMLFCDASPSSHLQEPAFQLLPQDQCAIDPKVLDLIRLHKYERLLLERGESLLLDDSEELPTAPVLSSNPTPTPVNHPLAELNENVARQILKKSICAMVAAAGFAKSLESNLDLLTDVTHEYLVKLSFSIQSYRDRQTSSNGSSDSVADAVFRALSDLKTGNPRHLIKWYQETVVKPVRVQSERCELLRQEIVERSVARVKTEEDAVEEDFLLFPNMAAASAQDQFHVVSSSSHSAVVSEAPVEATTGASSSGPQMPRGKPPLLSPTPPPSRMPVLDPPYPTPSTPNAQGMQ